MNRLTSANQSGTTSSFYYDGLGRQVARVINGTATYSVWDGWNLFAEYSGGTQTNRWIWAGNDLIRSPGMYYYPDASGSIAYLVTGTGVAEQYYYDAYGTPTFADGNNTPLSGSNYGVDFLLNGQKWYPQLGIYDLRNRAFLPEIGRFLQPDPIGFSGDPANLYRYCGNNPANGSDPLGTNLIVATYGTIPVVDHIGIGLAYNGPNSETYGFYSSVPNSPRETSNVELDPIERQNDYVIIETTPEQDQAVLDFIDFMANNPLVQDYNLYDANCSDFFVENALALAGIYVHPYAVPRIMIRAIKKLPNVVAGKPGGRHASGGGESNSPSASSYPRSGPFFDPFFAPNPEGEQPPVTLQPADTPTVTLGPLEGEPGPNYVKPDEQH